MDLAYKLMKYIEENISEDGDKVLKASDLLRILKEIIEKEESRQKVINSIEEFEF